MIPPARALRLVAALVLALAGAAPASAYVRSRVPGLGPCLWWGTRTVPVAMNAAGSDDVTDGSDQVAVERSAQAWSRAAYAGGQAACTDLELAFQGRVSDGAVGYAGDGHDTNLVVWREARCQDVAPSTDACWSCADTGGTCCSTKYGCWDHSAGIIALTTTTFDRATGQLVDADIELNGADFYFTTVDGPVCDDPASPPRCASDGTCPAGQTCFRDHCLDTGCARTDIQNTVTHEAGHVVGLDHATYDHPEATMAATAPLGEIAKRTLAEDDVQGICDIYPAGGATLTCLGDQVTLTPLSSTDEVRGCGGCDGSGGEAGGLALLLVAWALRRRRPAAVGR